MSPQTRLILEDMAQVLQHLLLEEPAEARLAFGDLKAKLHPPRPRTHCPACLAPLVFHPAENRNFCPACGRSLNQP